MMSASVDQSARVDGVVCAGSLAEERLHDVQPDTAAYTLLTSTGRRLLFCSRACLEGWCECLLDGLWDGEDAGT